MVFTLLVSLTSAYAGLADHEALDGVTHVQSSDHFSVKWGDDWTPEVGWIGEALDDLETSYQIQIDALGFSAPDGMGIARFNVYVSDSGVSVEGHRLSMPWGVAGMYGVDPDGWPLVLLSHEAWAVDATSGMAPGAWLEGALAHEWHHTVQLSQGAYTGPAQHWWWEGMAVWVSEQQVPDRADSWSNALLLRAQPEPALEHFDLDLFEGIADGIDADELLAMSRAYGSFVLPTWLSEELGRTDLVVTWATEDEGVARPIARLEDLLADEEMSLGEVVAETWGALQALDLAGSRALPAGLVGEEAVPEGRNPTMVVGSGAEGVSPPEGQAPGHLGANVVRIESPKTDLVFLVDPDPTGTEGAASAWVAAAVRCQDDVCTHEVLGLADDDSPVWTVAAAGIDRLDLILVPVAQDYQFGETFPYRLSVEPAAPAEGPTGCGCAHAPGRSVLALWPMAFVLVTATRRREAR